MVEGKAPVFVKVDDYKAVTGTLALIKDKIVQARDLFNKIAEIKSEEDSTLSNWASSLDEVEQRVVQIDGAFGEPGV